MMPFEGYDPDNDPYFKSRQFRHDVADRRSPEQVSAEVWDQGPRARRPEGANAQDEYDAGWDARDDDDEEDVDYTDFDEYFFPNPYSDDLAEER